MFHLYFNFKIFYKQKLGQSIFNKQNNSRKQVTILTELVTSLSRNLVFMQFSPGLQKVILIFIFFNPNELTAH